MPASDGRSAKAKGRGLLIAFGAVVIAGVVYLLWPAATPPAAPSNQSRTARSSAAAHATGPLNVRLDALKQPPPQPSASDRNPFRFQPKAPPPLPSRPPGARGLPGSPDNPSAPGHVGPPLPPAVPPVPPIPLKFIGTLEGREQGKVAIFVPSDGHGGPVYGREGQLVLGQFRIVKIGIESVVMEYADGRGRQTIPLRGQ